MASSPGLTTLDGLRERGAFVVAGLSRRFNDSNKHEIPQLWDRFAPHLPLTGQTGSETYGVEWDAGWDGDPGGFNYMAAVAVAPDVTVPSHLERKEIPAQRYLVFRLTLDDRTFHEQMDEAVPEIWMKRVPNSGYKRSRGPDFEFYPANFVPPREGAALEFWVPVETA